MTAVNTVPPRIVTQSVNSDNELKQTVLHTENARLLSKSAVLPCGRVLPRWWQVSAGRRESPSLPNGLCLRLTLLALAARGERQGDGPMQGKGGVSPMLNLHNELAQSMLHTESGSISSFANILSPSFCFSKLFVMQLLEPGHSSPPPLTATPQATVGAGTVLIWDIILIRCQM